VLVALKVTELKAVESKDRLSVHPTPENSIVEGVALIVVGKFSTPCQLVLL
jgi:hypothetical protein